MKYKLVFPQIKANDREYKSFWEMPSEDKDNFIRRELQKLDSEWVNRSLGVFVKGSEKIHLFYGSKQMSKDAQGGSYAFADQELELFDKLGFTLTRVHSLNTKQDITDWFNKAFDATINVNNPLVLGDAVEKFYKKLYDGDIYDFKMEKSSWQGSSGYEIYYKLWSENDEKIKTKHRVLLLKYKDSKSFEISKDVETDQKGFYATRNAERFTNKELEFFDKLGFVMNDSQTDEIDQNIEDWFTGGEE